MSDEKQRLPTPTSYGLTPEEMAMRKKRNLAIALGLGVFIIIIFAVTILRIGGAVADRSF